MINLAIPSIIGKKTENCLYVDLDKIPGDLLDHEPLNFNVSRLNNDKDHRIFRFVPIDKIDILISPCLRTDPLKEKYANIMFKWFNK